jgi:hypothetical protein
LNLRHHFPAAGDFTPWMVVPRRDIIGQSLTLDTYGRRDYTIVGIMPPGFGLPSREELWLPLGWMDVSLTERRSAHWHNVIARLKPGVTLAQAQCSVSPWASRSSPAFCSASPPLGNAHKRA